MAFDDGVKTVSGSIAHTEDAATKVPFVSVKCGIEPTLTGVSEVSATQTGKNFLPVTMTSGTTNLVDFTVNSDGTITADGTAPSKTIKEVGTFVVPKDMNIRFSGCTGGSISTYSVNVKLNDVWKSDVYNGSSALITVHKGDTLTFAIVIRNGVTVDNVVFSPMIRLATDTDAYEPYTAPTQYTASLGRTIHGGSADIVNGTGTDSGVKYTLDGTQAVTMFSTTDTNVKRFSVSIPSDSITTTTDRTDIISDVDILPTTTNAVTSAGGNGIHYRTNGSHNIIVCFGTDVPLSSVEEYNAYVSEHNIEIVYTLATPTDFTFTPITPTPESVGKVNNVCCNTGDTELTYHDNAHGFAEVTVNKTGKNLIDGTKFTRGLPSTTIGASINAITTSNRYAYYGIRAGGGSLTVSSTSSDTDYFTLVLIWGYKDGVLTYYSNTQAGTSKTVDFSNCDYVRIGIGTISGAITVPTDLTGYGTIQLELGSQASSYEPYEAVSKTAYLHKVIYGGTADVVRGTCEPKNLLKLSDGTYSVGNTGASATISNGSIVVTGTTINSGGRTIRLSDYFTLKAGTYILSPVISTSPYVRSYLNKKSDNSVVGYSSGYSFTVDEDVEVYFGVNVESGYTYDATITPQLEAGSSISDYTPYFDPFTFPPISMETEEGENTLFANEGDSAITYRKAVD